MEKITPEKEFTTLSPKLDVVFQSLFGEVGSESFTSRFLKNILKKEINSIDLSQNPILRRTYPNDKMGILDINLGNTYNNLQKTIVILIADFELNGLEQLDYFTSWKIIEEKERKTILTEKFEICIIELPKISNLTNDDELLDWLFFLDNPNSERVIKKMKENKELRKAYEKLNKLSHDEEMCRIAEWREKAIISENTNISASIKQTREEIAVELLKQGMDVDFIHKTTKLSILEIEELKNSLQ